ncbi:alpha-L-arabinofuranosidase B [Mycena leptocephala]|nr:alpha-L-arabinofuranosidase B [Mycena leptocephala]
MTAFSVSCSGSCRAHCCDAAFLPKMPRLSTPWTSQVSLTNPLPEYPRPQLVRTDWQNLNGQWQFAASSQITSPPTGQTLAETILVPYPLESALSGIMRHETNSFYRRTFTIPAGWTGRNVQINFGAVTWQTNVWVNGVRNERANCWRLLSVDAAGIPLGKQRLVPRAFSTRQRAALNIAVQTTGASGQTVTAIVSTGGQTVANSSATVGSSIRLSSRTRVSGALTTPSCTICVYTFVWRCGHRLLWHAHRRHRYRQWVPRPVLNGRSYSRWALSIRVTGLTALHRTHDAALRFDLAQQKALGFNTVRKHIKVEPARWYFHADQLGLLVFQDMPATRTSGTLSASDKTNFEDELQRIINQLRGITSIVQWIPFNEGWGEYDEARITTLVKSLDGTRLVNGNSGSSCCGRDPGNGDIIDDHIYVGPGSTNVPTSARVAQLGEFGGLGLRVSGHEWQAGAGSSYEIVADATALNQRYTEVTNTLQGLMFARGLSGSIYTEPTDVENEVNGYYTYDRQVFKGNFDQFKAAQVAVLSGAAWLRAGEAISLGVTTSGFTDRYVRHQDGLGITSTISDALSRHDTTFRARAGLADSSCFSFESRNFPGSYLRHSNFRLRLDPSDGTTLFNSDATFCLRAGHTSSGVPAPHQREVYIASNGGSNAWDSAAGWAADTTWQVASPWWRSGAEITQDSRVSLQVTTAGLTDRYVRHQNSLAITTSITSAADATTKSDATFTARAGLADASCYSFESVNFPGEFLRHMNFRLQIATSDNTEVFNRDATFCAQVGIADASAVTLWSYNIAGHAMRHINAEVWLSTRGGPHTQDANPSTYAADATFKIASPWAP